MLVDGLYATQLSIPEQKPILNPYIIPSADDLAGNADIEKLKGYLFLREADPNDPDAVAINWPDADGNPVPMAVIGTNDPAAEGILLRENDNYTVQLGKLLDVKGEEWKSSKTAWAEAAGGVVGVKAAYSYQLTSNGGWADGDELIIAGTTFTVGEGGFTQAVANDSARLAAFVAAELNKNGGDYIITANGGRIVYTARTAGAIGGDGPAQAPTLTLTDPGNKLTLGAQTTDVQGVDSAPPANPDPPAGTVTDPATGNKVTTAYTEIEGAWYRVTIETEYTREVVLDDNDLYGSLQAQREMLTEEGEFSSADDITIDENAKIKRGIPYYQKSFDLLAQQIAKHFNELNQGYMLNHKGNYVDENGQELLLAGADEAGNPVAAAPISKYDGLTPEQARNLIGNGFILRDEKGRDILDANGNQQADVNAWLKENGGVFMGGPLFSNRNDGNDTTGITASNIAVSSGWSSSEWMVVPKFEVLFPGDETPEGSMDHTTQNININHMISLMDAKLVYDPKDIDPDAVGANLFTGSFNDMFSNMMGVQAKDAKATSIALNNDYTTLVALDSSREGVSGVDLNDEAMNMVQYQKAMNAAMRLMTAIDEALDRLINNTGIAGR